MFLDIVFGDNTTIFMIFLEIEFEDVKNCENREIFQPSPKELSPSWMFYYACQKNTLWKFNVAIENGHL